VGDGLAPPTGGLRANWRRVCDVVTSHGPGGADWQPIGDKRVMGDRSGAAGAAAMAVTSVRGVCRGRGIDTSQRAQHQ